jgi:hypothetical protein
VQVAPEIIADLCRKHGPGLFAPVKWQGTPLDRVRLLWAIAGVESSFGLNCTPRHEQGYCYSGKYFDRQRSHDWGCLAHCSFGPWQVMYPHFPLDVSPLSLMWDADGRVAAEIGCLGAVRVLNDAIARGVDSFGGIAVSYNGPADEATYSAHLGLCYDRPMPEPVSAVSA